MKTTSDEYLPPPYEPVSFYPPARVRPTTLIDRLPPYSEEAEQGLLACVMHSQLETLEQCAAMDVKPESFYDLKHRTIYQAMVRLCMAAKRIDTITLSDHLNGRHELENVGGLVYLSTLPDKTPSASMAGEYIAIILEHGVRRATISLCTEAVEMAYEKTPDAWLSDFRDRVVQLRIGSSIAARPLGTLIRPPHDDPTELIKHRFLCQRGSMLINGPTGMGKSSFTMQGLALFSNAMPFFGMVPVRPLTAVLIQAENDDGDLAEMRDGICEGLKFHVEQRTNFFNRVHVMTSNGTVGRRFCNEVVQPLLIAHKPDLLVIDPANSFMGGDNKEQKDVGAFLRTWLNPLLIAHNCACIMVHHTNKPPTGKEKPNWRNGEWAYAGSGSAEWANWARAVLSIQDTGTHGIYRLHAAKRGIRLHWRAPGAPDEPILEKLIGHSKDPGLIYWRDAEESEVKEFPKGRAKSYDQDALLELLNTESLTTSEWCAKAREETGITERSFFRAMRAMQSDELVLKSVASHKWTRIIKA